MSIIFISHKLNEVLEIADRVTVLRRGKVVETLPAAGATEEQLARLMVGREVLLRVEKSPSTPARRCSRSRTCTSATTAGIEKVRGVSLEVRAGEIVGIAGVDGNGQTELDRRHHGPSETGVRRRSSWRASTSRAKVAREHFDDGVGHIPEDRQRRGLVLDFSIAENIALHDFRKPPNVALRLAVPETAHRACEAADPGVRRPRGRPADARRARCPAATSRRSSSRGRSIGDPKVLIAAQPTRGLDVGAIEFVHRRLVEERDEGRAMLLVSLELEEILSLSDRILVMFEGEIVGEFPPTVDARRSSVSR